ncbi:MAG TPA: SPOR domain-containing protein [Pseudacidobacterium sp.]|jgi:cell division septation protein DedD|nr:SPOR domain-containing protein [Pseudacidobacterium sp.]
MRNTVEYEEENESEITLNATTLLGIFFGLVLVCGVFFGFGYSMGRRGQEAPSANTSAATPQRETQAPPTSNAPKPSAMEALQTADISASSENSAAVTEPVDSTTQSRAPASHVAAKPSPVSQATPAPKSASLPVAPAAAATPGTTATSGQPVMVQIAAVSRPEDANALASALRQHGYTVAIRNELQDKLLHVQVGPFPTRDAAKATRTKLLADGYNAILKP